MYGPRESHRKTYPEHFYHEQVRLRAMETIYDSTEFKVGFQDALRYARCSPDTLYRWWNEYMETGKTAPVTAKQNVCGVSDEHVDFLRAELVYKPTMYIREMTQSINSHFNVQYSTSQVFRALERHKLTRKVLERHAREQNPQLRNDFLEMISDGELVSPEMLVFVDETHCTHANARRKYGWSEYGRPAWSYCENSGGNGGVSAIAALALDGVMSVSTADIVDGDVFIDVLKNDILPKMNAYPSPRSVLVLDNASVHMKPAIIHACQLLGVVCLFLPPYSYDLNPIEKVFHLAKHWLRANYPDENPDDPLRNRLYSALTNDSITPHIICNLFVKCCIPVSNAVRQWASGVRD